MIFTRTQTRDVCIKTYILNRPNRIVNSFETTHKFFTQLRFRTPNLAQIIAQHSSRALLYAKMRFPVRKEIETTRHNLEAAKTHQTGQSFASARIVALICCGNDTSFNIYTILMKMRLLKCSVVFLVLWVEGGVVKRAPKLCAHLCINPFERKYLVELFGKSLVQRLWKTKFTSRGY